MFLLMQQLFLMEKNQMDFKSKPNDIRRGSRKSDKQDSEIRNIYLYNAWDNVFTFFEDYSNMMQHLKRTQSINTQINVSKMIIALAQVKASNTSKNLLNDICQIIYYLYQAKGVIKKVYKYIMNSMLNTKWLLHLWILKIVKHLIHKDYDSIFQIKQASEEVICCFLKS